MITFVAFVAGIALGAFLVLCGVEIERRRLQPSLLAYVASTEMLSNTLKRAEWHAVFTEPPTVSHTTRMH